LKKHPLRRRIYGISNKYEVRCENDSEKSLSAEEVVRSLFGEVISGRVYPDLFLENGARMHSEDSGFVQYATPECDDILQLIAHEKAGERILERLSLSAEAKANREGFKGRMAVFKLSDESSENYLLSKHVKPAQLRNALIPFLVTRQIFAGAGKVNGIRNYRYHISRRTNQIKVDISTSAKDGIVRIPDNPHADEERYQRLQALTGDANMSEWTSYLKIGSTALVIQMLEDDFIPNDFALQNPVIASQQIAVDLRCAEKIELSSGKRLTAIEIQREYLQLAKSYFDSLEVAPSTGDVLAKWEYALDCLESDPMRLEGEVDWVIKKRLLEKYRDEHNLEWHSPEISAMDLGYHNIRRAEGLYYDLEQEGKVKRLLTDEQIEESIHEPPQTTRAKFRGKYVKLANERKILCGVNWSYVQIYEPEQKLFLSTDPLEPDYEEASRMIYQGKNK
ncbi:MAG: proteasome accessory factor PafA2 family protein, partial [Candidatus Poribacteria bacterium]